MEQERSTARTPTEGSLQALLRPRSIALVGASRDEKSVGGAIFKNLLDEGFQGPVYPINRTARFVRSVRAYARLEDLPEVPDLAVVAVHGVGSGTSARTASANCGTLAC